MSNRRRAMSSLKAAILGAGEKKENPGYEMVNGVPQPKNFPQALEAIQDFLDSHGRLYRLLDELEKLIPQKEEETDKLSPEEFKSMFLASTRFDDLFGSMFGMSPPSIALVAIHEFFQDKNRFELTDPLTLPYAKDLRHPYQIDKLTHTTVTLGSATISVPISNDLWVTDKKSGLNYIVNYKPTMGGGIAVTVEAKEAAHQEATNFAMELKTAVLKSPYIKGQIIEISGGSEFNIVDIGPQPHPVMDASLKGELEKNVINLFKKRDQFDKYGLPLKRSIILEGPPGCGKTMLARWLASSVRGEVTTVWVTAKSIGHTVDVAEVFNIARKLSPSLVIMEDLDLISGSRSMMMGHGHNALGEMLNQLDGLTTNDSLVLVASTNKLSSLDEALRDRPGRFDRVYKVDKPNEQLAEVIAKEYLKKRGVPEPSISGLDFAPLTSGDWTGAQIVEIVKGAIFEAIHGGGPINDICLRRSAEGLKKQRQAYNNG